MHTTYTSLGVGTVYKKSSEKTISIRVHHDIKNLSIYHAERKQLNSLHVYWYKMVEIHVLIAMLNSLFKQLSDMKQC